MPAPRGRITPARACPTNPNRQPGAAPGPRLVGAGRGGAGGWLPRWRSGLPGARRPRPARRGHEPDLAGPAVDDAGLFEAVDAGVLGLAEHLRGAEGAAVHAVLLEP